MKLTEFGKAVRMLRLDTEVTLGDMADALEISPAYLSSMETGRREPQETIVERAIEFFEERGQSAQHLREAADRSRRRIDLSELDGDLRSAVAAFARKAPRDADMVRQVRELLAKEVD